MLRPTQQQIADWLGTIRQAVADMQRRGVLPKPLPELKQCVHLYCEHLRTAAAGRRSDGPLDLAQERAALARSQRERIDIEIRRQKGELVLATEVERTLVATLKILISTLETLPDILERDAGISGAAVERVQTIVDRVRDRLHAKLVQYANDACPSGRP